jgi:hypothetical protein
MSNMKKFSPELYKRVKELRKHPERGNYVDCASSSSSDSSDSSDYSSSDGVSDIEWVGFPA